MKVLKQNCDEYITTDTTLITTDTTLITTDIYYSECFINGEQYYYFQFNPRGNYIGDVTVTMEDELSGVVINIDGEVIKYGNFHEVRFYNNSLNRERKYNLKINNGVIDIYYGKAIYTNQNIQNYGVGTIKNNKIYY